MVEYGAHPIPSSARPCAQCVRTGRGNAATHPRDVAPAIPGRSKRLPACQYARNGQPRQLNQTHVMAPEARHRETCVRLRPEHHLLTVVVLALEELVPPGGVLQVQAVRDDEC